MAATGMDKRPLLEYAGLVSRGDLLTLTLRLKGRETAVSKIVPLLKEKYPKHGCEWDATSRCFTAHVAVKSPDEALEVATMVHEATNCRLSHVQFDVDSRALFPGNKASPYESLIIVTPTLDMRDENNRVGDFSAEIIRHKQGAATNLTEDPLHTDDRTIKFIDYKTQHATDTEALLHAQKVVQGLESEFGTFVGGEHVLKLVDLHRSNARKEVDGKDVDVYYTHATLQGREERDIESAEATLKHRYRNAIRMVRRDKKQHKLEVAAGDVRPLDPTGLLMALHSATGCEVPVKLVPASARGEDDLFRPCLKVPVAAEVLQNRDCMANAAALYAGSFIPEPHHVPLVAEHAERRLIIRKPFEKAQEAEATADTIRSRVVARMGLGAVAGRA